MYFQYKNGQVVCRFNVIGVVSMKKRSNMRWVLPIAGVLLILLATRSVALMAVGQKARAKVIEVKQVIDNSSEPMDHNYSIGYRFSVDGKTYTGHTRRNKVYNASRLPKTGSYMSVRYLAPFPQINGDSRENPLQVVLLGGLGVILLFFGINRQRSSNPGRTNE